jgi:hypothetical protein
MAKKDFLNNISPAAAFISNAAGVNNVNNNDNVNVNNEVKEEKEKRDARANLLFTKTTKRNLEKIAVIDRTSVNDIINKLLEDYLETRKSDIARYDEFFKD